MIFFGVVITSVLVFVCNQPFGATAMAWLLGRGAESQEALQAPPPVRQAMVE